MCPCTNGCPVLGLVACQIVVMKCGEVMQVQTAVQILGEFVFRCPVGCKGHFVSFVTCWAWPSCVIRRQLWAHRQGSFTPRGPCVDNPVLCLMCTPRYLCCSCRNCLKQRTLLGIQNFISVPFKQASYQTLHWHQINGIKWKSSGSTHMVLTKGAIKVHPSQAPSFTAVLRDHLFSPHDWRGALESTRDFLLATSLRSNRPMFCFLPHWPKHCVHTTAAGLQNCSWKECGRVQPLVRASMRANITICCLSCCLSVTKNYGSNSFVQCSWT